MQVRTFYEQIQNYLELRDNRINLLKKTDFKNIVAQSQLFRNKFSKLLQ